MKSKKPPSILIPLTLVIVALLGLLLLATNDVSLFVKILYSPYSFLVLFLMLVEYLFLKGMDRSKVYKLENKRLKLKRQKDIALMKKIETQISALATSINDETKPQEIQKRLDAVLKNLKNP